MKADTYAYRVGDGIYLNLTNRCTNRCTFCIRNNGDGAYGSDSLWLNHEPSAEEVLAAVQDLLGEGGTCKEFVFCGYGEPTMRMDVLLQVAAKLKATYSLPIRLNTNGQAMLYGAADSIPRFAGLLDCVSVSLNAPDAADYVALCKPEAGEKAFDAMLAFTEECTKYVPNVVMTVVGETLDKYRLTLCHAVARRCGATLRVRTYIGKA